MRDNQLTYQDIQEIIKRYEESYLKNPSLLFAGYNTEREIVKEYNGRQILELLQNADDANTDKISIEFSSSKKQLIISNMGIGFCKNGVESLMFAGISSKNKTEFIGNKGLGFRSILNWVNKVKVITQNLSL